MAGYGDDDDDFPEPLTQRSTPLTSIISHKKPLKPSNLAAPRPSKKPKPATSTIIPGKENTPPSVSFHNTGFNQHGTVQKSPHPLSDIDAYALGAGEGYGLDDRCGLDLIQSRIDCALENSFDGDSPQGSFSLGKSTKANGVKVVDANGGYFRNSIESKLMASRLGYYSKKGHGGSTNTEAIRKFEVGPELQVLLNMCSEEDGGGSTRGTANNFDGDGDGGSVHCPLCGIDISDLSEDRRQVHTNDCLDKEEIVAQEVVLQGKGMAPDVAPQVIKASLVIDWLHNLGLEKYVDIFVREEIDWSSLQWLTEEDLFNIGITALGPRKKIVHALSELRKGTEFSDDRHVDDHVVTESGRKRISRTELNNDLSNGRADESKLAANKLITDFFRGSHTDRKEVSSSFEGKKIMKESHLDSSSKKLARNHVKNGKFRNVPSWCCIPGTPFRVDAFKYLRSDCSHWFLTHFHMDHYQGLTRSFNYGKIYCSSITARLVNMKIGIPLEKIQVLPLNQKINVSGIDVTCLDANHCPGSIIILFQPPNGKAVLHTGDFRFSEEMASNPLLLASPINTLILDTTYCNPQYDFPKQESVIQFVIDAIQAEAFNPKTLFLIGSYTIGKERLFLEVARVLQTKVYVTAAKLHLLKCLGFQEEDMQCFTSNEMESNIHVVPLWTLASFKRLKHISNQYSDRFSLIVAFSPTGWTFGKGKKKSPGRRWQQGTIIRYEVPYSEHCSFTELKEFVKLVSPVNVVPSVNNDGPDSANYMISLLLS